jgi:hypothetical protein
MISDEMCGIKRLQSELWCRFLYSCLLLTIWVTVEKQHSPTIYTAVCGGTGSSKSSLLSALLVSAYIVPTSGMRACIAVVTEIRHHKHEHISAQVDFLSRPQWKEELTLLLEDLRDDDGTIRRMSDLRNEAGVAWHKVWPEPVYWNNGATIRTAICFWFLALRWKPLSAI